jgi:hypothetical protein
LIVNVAPLCVTVQPMPSAHSVVALATTEVEAFGVTVIEVVDVNADTVPW